MVKAKIKDLAPGAFFNAGPAVMTVLEHFADGRTLLVAKEPIGNRPFTVGSPPARKTKTNDRVL